MNEVTCNGMGESEGKEGDASYDEYVCILCGCEIEGFGNNPWPLSEHGRCCDMCNIDVVVKRMEDINKKGGKQNE